MTNEDGVQKPLSGELLIIDILIRRRRRDRKGDISEDDISFFRWCKVASTNTPNSHPQLPPPSKGEQLRGKNEKVQGSKTKEVRNIPQNTPSAASRKLNHRLLHFRRGFPGIFSSFRFVFFAPFLGILV